ncbi:hypothetical protein OV203_00950 [Nannocystis sp. ILAH1]|uniref:hypothetical protein n=1 Tax=unclassified Nannocystis TaxID=2627009 RepID=UPI00226EB771|nr:MULTISPECIES: hypothetical protein [unclassified Nannocystis]MCY0985678.1 hypothetical protein [Nannocystis sp. ILAH1]MCY1068363.1 hypothetical protein [Nannocystis sp. RBIL2]
MGAVRLHPSAALLCAPLLFACGESKPGAQSKSIAAAFETQSDPAESAKKAGEDMRRLKEKVEADRAKAIVADIDKAATVPESLPADIKTACAEMRAAYDAFVGHRLGGDKAEADRWAVMKDVDLDPAQEFCVAQNNLRFAACQTHAFREAAPGIARERAQELIDTCARKTGAPTRAELKEAERAGKTLKPS